jgi:hypothetical protein
MAWVLTTASDVLCGPAPTHGGRVKTVSAAKLTVKNQPVLVKTSVAGKPIDLVNKCAITPNANTGDKPCGMVSTVSQGEATKLTAGTFPVLLKGQLQGSTDGTIAGVLQTALTAPDAKQNRLTAV